MASKNNISDSFYGEIRSALHRYASRFFKRPQDIEDVVQEAFANMLEAQKHTTIESPKSYIFRTTKHLALNEIGKSANKFTAYLGDFPDETVSPIGPQLEDEIEAKERLDLLCVAVQQLPPKCQQAFILRRVYGYSQKEIAEEMGISVKTVEIHLTKAILHCTEFMNDIDTNQQPESIDVKSPELRKRSSKL